jgi:hypothetical protein
LENDVEDVVVSVDRLQCSANTQRGGRCVRHAKPGHDVCGLHIHQQTYSQRQDQNTVKRIPCIHYKENTDHDDIDFCNGRTPNQNTWFCKRHTHLQSMYERIYGARSAHHYLVLRTQDDTSIKSNEIVDNFIKDNSDLFV